MGSASTYIIIMEREVIVKMYSKRNVISLLCFIALSGIIVLVFMGCSSGGYGWGHMNSGYMDTTGYHYDRTGWMNPGGWGGGYHEGYGRHRRFFNSGSGC
jgi:hypothetical protein